MYNSIPTHTYDIIVFGSNVGEVEKVLDEFTPENCGEYISVKGDSYADIENELKENNVEIVNTSASETISEIVVYFTDYLY